jgi:hypothetical protein
LVGNVSDCKLLEPAPPKSLRDAREVAINPLILPPPIAPPTPVAPIPIGPAATAIVAVNANVSAAANPANALPNIK